MATLRITGGPDVGKTFTLNESAVLGRLASNEVPLRDAACSRQHARVYRQGSEWMLTDLDSANGTTVDGQRIRRVALASGSRFRVGQTVLELTYEAEAARAAPRASAPRTSTGAATPEVELRGASAERVLVSEASKRKSGRPDLTHLPPELRMLGYAAAVALMIGLAWLAYSLTGGA